MNKLLRIFRSVLVLLAAAIFFAVSQDANAQTAERKVTINVRPARSVEERVADKVMEKELRRRLNLKRGE
ncbi:MAG TPA: hypothetical protein VFS10_03915 [Pyrinomonadaceae bacterium]|nr:hypothetical protein [Pyrinomonadaceae bacterium]